MYWSCVVVTFELYGVVSLWCVCVVQPDTQEKIAIIGMEDRMAFVKVTRNSNGAVDPVVLATLLKTQNFTDRDGNVIDNENVVWSDVKIYNNFAFITRERNHGMQVFDLKKLRELYDRTSADVPVEFNESDIAYFYPIINSDSETYAANCHNMVINEQTGFGYLVGTSTCSGGLHVVDISSFGKSENPEAIFVGCFDEDGYTHDAVSDWLSFAPCISPHA